MGPGVIPERRDSGNSSIELSYMETDRFSCSLCDYDTRKFEKLKRHYENKHEHYEILQCPLCGYAALEGKGMKKHRKEFHASEKYTCSSCDFSTKRWKKWMEHYRQSHNKDDINSVECLSSTSNTEHSVQNTESENMPDTRDQPSVDGGNLLTHNAEENSVGDPGQELSSTTTAARKKMHKRNHISERYSEEQSSQGKTGTGTVSSDANSEGEFSSQDKERSLCNSTELQDTDEDKTSSKMNICNQCGKSFKYKTLLSQHLVAHSDAKPFKCSICNFASRYSRGLKRHNKQHTDKEKYDCEVCEKSFSSKTNLTCHMRTHSDERPYACPYCEYSATQKVNLDTHLRGHNDNRIFHCKFCEYSTPYMTTLQNHEKVHTDERPYTCSVCDRKFKRRSHLKSHEHSKHKMKVGLFKRLLTAEEVE